VLLVALAPEIDRRYEQLVAYLHDDAGRPWPTVDLVLNLLCPDLATRVAARTRFSADAPLVRHRLVQVAGEPGHRSASLLGKTVVIDPRVVRFVLEDDGLDERLAPLARLVVPSLGLDELVLPAGLRPRLDRLVELARSDVQSDLVVYWQGTYGVGKQAAAEAVCDTLDTALLVVDGRRLASLTPVDELTALVGLIDREARLQGTVIYWEDFDLLLAGDKQAHLAAVLPVLAAHPDPVFLAGQPAWEPRDALHDRTFVRVELPSPGYGERLALWHTTLGETTDDLDLPALAGKFRLTGGQIADAAATARNLAAARGSDTVSEDVLLAACRVQSTSKLAELAQKIEPHFTWDDIVLPADQMTLLRELHATVEHRAIVHDTWGFDAKLATGKGLNVLFAGPPGTGKTMAADVLAHTLGLDLYKVDLSGVLSKYIGETEKNLARIFDEATTSNAILFFDEADALFGKRTAVRDAHDRYANVEVSYLLQRMDDYDGVVILATNLRKNIDDAFVRRLHFTIDLPLPGPDDRRRIWSHIWPAAAPLDPGLDLDLLAERIPVAGGSIRNIALASAFLAATDGQIVTMDHVLHATRREYQKMGKVLATTDLGDLASPREAR
jgi:AAA+ superfamily predicted ATPase